MISGGPAFKFGQGALGDGGLEESVDKLVGQTGHKTHARRNCHGVARVALKMIRRMGMPQERNANVGQSTKATDPGGRIPETVEASHRFLTVSN